MTADAGGWLVGMDGDRSKWAEPGIATCLADPVFRHRGLLGLAPCPAVGGPEFGAGISAVVDETAQLLLLVGVELEAGRAGDMGELGAFEFVEEFRDER